MSDGHPTPELEITGKTVGEMPDGMSKAEGLIASALEQCALKGHEMAVVVMAGRESGTDIMTVDGVDHDSLSNLFLALAQSHYHAAREEEAAANAELVTH